jgi:hypothetical protein
MVETVHLKLKIHTKQRKVGAILILKVSKRGIYSIVKIETNRPTVATDILLAGQGMGAPKCVASDVVRPVLKIIVGNLYPVIVSG